MRDFKLALIFLLWSPLWLASCYQEGQFWYFYGKLVGAWSQEQFWLQKHQCLASNKHTFVFACGENDRYVLKLVFDPKYAKGSSIANEAAFYERLQGIKGIPNMYACYFGQGRGGMLTDRLGSSVVTLQLSIVAQPLIARAKIYRRIARLIRELHSRKVCHNDIKPDNLLALNDNSFDFTVIDFDYSCTAGKPCKQAHRAYTAPEVYAELKTTPGYHACTPSIDVWSLTLVIHYIESHEFSFNFPLLYTGCKEITYVCVNLLLATIRDYTYADPPFKQLIIGILARPYQQRNDMQVLIDELGKLVKSEERKKRRVQISVDARNTKKSAVAGSKDSIEGSLRTGGGSSKPVGKPVNPAHNSQTKLPPIRE